MGDFCGVCRNRSPRSFPEVVAGCCSRAKRSRPDKKGKSTPLPWSKLIVLCAVLFVNQFGINMIFPFLPFMVHDFFPYLNKAELGQKAGYLGGAYFLGNFLGSFIWGVASDKMGRRMVLLMGVFATILCELLFGFSQNMLWAVSARLMWGLLNGNIGVAKTYISEICDDTNQAKGFAAVGTTGGIGRLMGSVVGGFLAQPANKYPPLQFQLFCDYPYSLPCLVGAGISLFSFVSAWLFLDETLKKNKKRDSLADSSSAGQDSGIELLKPGSNSSDTSSNSQLREEDEIEVGEVNSEEEATSDLFEEDYDTDSDYDATSDTELLENIRRINRRNTLKLQIIKFMKACTHTFSLVRLARKVVQRLTECVGVFVVCTVGLSRFDYSRCRPVNVKDTVSRKWRSAGGNVLKTILLLKDRKVAISISLYGAIAFLAITMNEIFPLLLVTDHEHGGYNMDPSEIGVILSVAAILQLLFQSLVFPRVVNILKYRKTFDLGLLLFAISSIIFPFSNQISGHIPVQQFNFTGSGSGMMDTSIPFCGPGSIMDDKSNSTDIIGNPITRVPARVWAVIMIITTIQILGRVISITSVMVLISNASVPETRGTVNGYGQSVAALGRMFGPMAGAPMFAWSETLNNHWPLNYHLVFNLIAVGTIGAFILTLLLPKSIEQKRETTASSSNPPNDSTRNTVEQTSDVQLVSIRTLPGEVNAESESKNKPEPS